VCQSAPKYEPTGTFSLLLSYETEDPRCYNPALSSWRL
jgi:hypothetical protein